MPIDIAREIFCIVKPEQTRIVQWNTGTASLPIPLWNNFQNILNSYFQSLKLQSGRNAGSNGYRLCKLALWYKFREFVISV